MSLLMRSCVAVAVLLAGSLAVSQEKKEQAENPYYKYWSKSKVGATVSHKETTKVSAPEGGEGDSGEEVKLITHKLVELTAGPRRPRGLFCTLLKGGDDNLAN